MKEMIDFSGNFLMYVCRLYVYNVDIKMNCLSIIVLD